MYLRMTSPFYVYSKKGNTQLSIDRGFVVLSFFKLKYQDSFLQSGGSEINDVCRENCATEFKRFYLTNKCVINK